MNLADFCLRRPVMTTLLAVAVTLAGALCFFRLPVSNLPNVDFPTITVSAAYPGASPETMAAAVAVPLEKKFAQIEGVTSIISANILGNTNITLQFSLDRDLDACALDVMSAITAAGGDLPDDLPSQPRFRKVNPSLSPVLIFALSSERLPLTEVNYYAETLVAQRLSMVEGVASVNVFGSQKRAVRVRLDPLKLAARGLSPVDVAAALARANVNLPVGILSGPTGALTLRTNDTLPRAADYRDLVLVYGPAGPLRLRDVADVVDAAENDRSGSWLDGRPAVSLAVQRQPGANAVAVAGRVKAIMPELRELVPAAVDFDLRYDGSRPMVASVREVAWTIVHTVILVVLVTYVFLRSGTATAIPSLALPISLLATGLVFAARGYSVDTLSLLALTLAVGFVTDDAVVVLENIYRHREKGLAPAEAAAVGAAEISFSVVGMTLSLAAVFIPFLFMGGVVGRLFSEFSVVIASAILVSGAVSLTVTPLLCATFLKAEREKREGPAARVLDAGFQRLLAFYKWTLDAALAWPRTVLAIGVAMAAATFLLFRAVPTDFLPADDQGLLTVATEAAPGASYDDMVRLHTRAAEIIGRHPDVQSVVSSVGSSSSTMNNGSFQVMLRDRAPAGPRRRAPDAVAADLRRELAALPGLACYPTPPPAIRFGGRSAKSQYQLTLQGQDSAELYAASEKLLAALRQRRELADVATDLQLADPTLAFAVDRDKASALGFTMADIDRTLGAAYAGGQVATILGDNEQYQVITELAPEHRRWAEDADNLHLAAAGRAVPLATLARRARTTGPLVVNHAQQNPAVTLSFNLAPGVPLGEAAAAALEEARRILPADVQWGFQGTAQVFEDSLRGMAWLLLLAILVIYVVLGILYENYWHPLTILSGLPAALAGGLAALLLLGRPLDIYGMVGLVLLVGLVKKNAILVVDFALTAMREPGKTPLAAAREGSLARFRPILMTTLAALAAGLLISVAGGQSGDTRRGLGFVLCGGLVVAQIVTLYLTPVIFQYVERLRAWPSARSSTVKTR